MCHMSLKNPNLEMPDHTQLLNKISVTPRSSVEQFLSLAKNLT